ncbi:MAG: SH3 domain-containing protein [Chloroflexi bacterium]|nr:SH3 domain-containing protein [Chloroflexota bacterium]
MLLPLFLIAVALLGLCQVSGLLSRLRPLPMPTLTPMPGPTATPQPALALTPTAGPTATLTALPLVMPGVQVTVSGTGGQQLSLRAGPGQSQARLRILTEGTRLLVLDGPEAGDGYQWWKVRTDDGVEGWVAGDWLTPVSP